MSRDLGPCPPADDLERLLTEQLGASLRESVETHVESCSSCQDRLERLSVKPARTVKIAVSGIGSGPEPSAEFLRRLRGTPPSWPNGKSPSITDSLDRLPRWFEHGRIGQYEILEKLGKGGMGTVYKARHAELGKIVALKVLPADQMDEVRIGRFKNEVRAIGQLDHPHIVAAHDAGETGGVHYLVMDFADGEDLGRVVDRYGRLSVADACAAIREAALGLQHAFERGIVHRDIKPSNLMLTRSGRVQVLDLGLARSFRDLAADRLTADGMVLGTADYLAPEQWERARAVDIRADIYSLGCSLYHLLAGRPPFGGRQFSSLLEKLRGHVDTPVPAITGLRPEVPPGIVAILDRMLAKSPADRFATPAEVAEAMRPFTEGSDLSRLVGPGGALPTVDATTTPVPAMLDTATDSRRVRTVPMRRRYLLPGAVAALGLAILAVVFFWPRGAAPTVPAAPPLAITNLHVDHYRGDNKTTTSLGDLRDSGAAVRVKDQVAVVADFNTPAYFYLIAFNPVGSKGGTIQLCQPDDAAGEGVNSAAPGKQKKVRYPRDDGLVEVDAAGLQVFVVAASSQPLPPFAEWKASARDIPWKGTDDGGTWCWHSSGDEFTRLPRNRPGRVIVPPEPLRELRDWFKARPEFEVVQMFAFPVTSNPE